MRRTKPPGESNSRNPFFLLVKQEYVFFVLEPIMNTTIPEGNSHSLSSSLEGRIWTCDFSRPRRAIYQADLHPDKCESVSLTSYSTWDLNPYSRLREPDFESGVSTVPPLEHMLISGVTNLPFWGQPDKLYGLTLAYG